MMIISNTLFMSGMKIKEIVITDRVFDYDKTGNSLFCCSLIAYFLLFIHFRSFYLEHSRYIYIFAVLFQQPNDANFRN